jgi:hypothetical protein
MKAIVTGIVLFFLSSLISIAQEIPELRIVGQGELQENEIVASIIRDVNGRIASGLIIESDLTELAYESNNGIIKRDIKPGRDFLFLSPDERIVTVYKSGYKPLKIILADVGVRLRSSMVFKISITADKKRLEVPVNFVVSPTNAKILLNNELEIKNETTTQILEGRYALEISADGYETLIDSILVTPENTLFNFTLSEQKIVKVSIATTPEQATVFMGEENVGLTNLIVYKQTGRYPIRISKAGYTEIKDTLTIIADKSNEFAFDLSANTGQLVLNLTEKDASIFINKQEFTGQAAINLNPGIYELEILKTGFESHTELIEIKKSEVVQRSISLKPHAGSLTVNVAQQKAKVSLYQLNGDFTSAWIGNKSLDSIPAGRYQIAIQLEEYYPIQDEFVILPERDTQKFYSFSDEQLIANKVKSTTSTRKKNENRDGFVMFYGGSNGLSFGTDGYRTNVSKNKTYEGGLVLAGESTMINLAFAQFNSSFLDDSEFDTDDSFAIMLADAAFKMDGLGPFHPYIGLGYMMTTMNGDLRQAFLNETEDDSSNFHAAYYRYGLWFLLGEGASLNIGIGYDVRKSFRSPVKFETGGFQLGIAFKF